MKANVELETLQVIELLKWHPFNVLLINENITPEDPEQPEERTWVGEGVEGRKRERSGTADEGVDGG